MPWGDTLVAGFQAGSAVRDRKKQRELDEKMAAADADLRRNLTDKQLAAHAQEVSERRADAARQVDAHAKEVADERARMEADPVYRVQRLKAQKEIDTFNNPPPTPAAMARISRTLPGGATAAYDAPVDQLGSLFPAEPPAAPTAKVSQAFGDGDKSRVEYSLPLDDARKMAGASGYRSPFADDIAELGRQITDQQAEVDGGDNRTGFLNMTSRQDVIGKATNQRRRLQAMELQDMLGKGVIDQQEADRRADLVRQGAL